MVTAVCDIIAAVVSLRGRDVFRLNGGGGVCAVAMVTWVAVCDGLRGGEGAGVQETAAKYTCREEKKTQRVSQSHHWSHHSETAEPIAVRHDNQEQLTGNHVVV